MSTGNEHSEVGCSGGYHIECTGCGCECHKRGSPAHRVKGLLDHSSRLSLPENRMNEEWFYHAPIPEQGILHYVIHTKDSDIAEVYDWDGEGEANAKSIVEAHNTLHHQTQKDV